MASLANPRPHAAIDDLSAELADIDGREPRALFTNAPPETETDPPDDLLDNPLDAPLDSGAIAAWITRLATFRRDVSDTERVDQIRALEQLKAAAAGAQARIAVDLDASVQATHAAAGIPVERQGRGVAGQVALARQESPYRGGRHLGLATTLVTDLPHTLTALERGVVSEWRASLLVRETICLSREHRRLIDIELCADPTRLEGWGDRRPRPRWRGCGGSTAPRTPGD